MSMTIREVLSNKPEGAVTVAPSMGVDQAVATMVENNVGCVVAVDEHYSPVGVLSERDILRLYNQRHAETGTLRVEDVMTRDVVVGTMDSKSEDVLTEMTRRRFRHMPIVRDGHLIGLVSLGDLVKARLARTESEAESLKQYIYDSPHSTED